MMEYNHDIGMYIRWNKNNQLEVKDKGIWRLYTAAERAKPLIDWLEHKAKERTESN